MSFSGDVTTTTPPSGDEPVVVTVLHDDEWNWRARAETPMQRLDRNWLDLMQEVRVLQTGVQLLCGFLLILPFQDRFADLTPSQAGTYLMAVSFSIAATGCLIAPVSLHRILFRRHSKLELVAMAHRLTIAGLLFESAAIVAVATLTFDIVIGPNQGWIAAGVAALLLATLWALLPLRVRRTAQRRGPVADGVAVTASVNAGV
jgi:hypothetical protein